LGVACLCFEPAGQGLADQLEQSASPHFAGKKRLSPLTAIQMLACILNKYFNVALCYGRYFFSEHLLGWLLKKKN